MFRNAANDLNYLPNSAQPGQKSALAANRNAKDTSDTTGVAKAFAVEYDAAWHKAAATSMHALDVLREFCNFPLEHRVHLPTTNPTESIFVTVRQRPRLNLEVCDDLAPQGNAPAMFAYALVMVDKYRSRFDRIVLIYNPSPAKIPMYLAQELHETLSKRLPAVPVLDRPTQYAGHARKIAREEAQFGDPLLVSISGDGGFNEVVNGVLDIPTSNAVCAVMPGGNANDHHRNTNSRPLVEAILHAPIKNIDLLRLTVSNGSEDWSRLAHSYIGFGLTPLMAIGIEAGRKGALHELISVARTIRGLRPFTIVRSDGARATMDSLVLANISGMAKYGKISESSGLVDGKFEVVMLPHASKWRIVLMTLRAVTIGLGEQPSVSSYAFWLQQTTPVQADGELMQISFGSKVVVDSVPNSLRVIS
ncbi:diacylglycerol kinase family protein [Glutamicibacter sp. V16R2B1]|uniref:diacylglycerol kinase family protein n=1 Tax=Glutamicibacter sp. V16R2B1 TaxID=2036207 RepID=UPI002018197E|nr:diacylglycerol kinase family protein [Glutamicibacter sp. V16R2B1]